MNSREIINPGNTSTNCKGVELNIVKYIVSHIYQNYKCYSSDGNVIIYIYLTINRRKNINYNFVSLDIFKHKTWTFGTVLKNANLWRVNAHYFRWNILSFIDV